MKKMKLRKYVLPTIYVLIILVTFLSVSLINNHLLKNVTNYNTPFGSIVIGLDASNISVEELEDEISVNVDYSIDANCEYLADCNIKMKIQATGK